MQNQLYDLQTALVHKLIGYSDRIIITRLTLYNNRSACIRHRYFHF